MSNIRYSIVDKSIGTEDVKHIDKSTLLFSYPCDSNFSCTPYKVVLERGLFQIECYGAGNRYNNHIAGGGYTSGIIKVRSILKLYLYLGAQGELIINSDYISNEEVFNGGGGNIIAGHTGSGATDVRLVKGDWKNFSSLMSRIMVAGGAGGSECGKGGDGGGLIGGSGGIGTCVVVHYDKPGTGATNSNGGKGLFEGKFGYATKPYTGDNSKKNYNCGGGGYYGGGSSEDNGAGGGGGSSYISGHPGCDAISIHSTESDISHTQQSIHYSNISFINTTLLSGSEKFISPDRKTIETGHISSGNVVITFLSPLYYTSKCTI